MFTKEVLKNGVRIVTEKIPNVRSLAIGIWVKTGSRNENTEINGISHFIEHLMFKGTENRTAKQIAEEIDNIGGQINAFTGKETTCYYTKTLDSHYKKAIDVLADMFFNSTFAKNNIDLERSVIVEEIGMYEDSLEELVHDVLSSSCWKNNMLGYPVLGTSETLSNIDRDKIIKYYKSRYVPHNVVISVTGNFQYDEIISELKKYFEDWHADNDVVTEYSEADFNEDIAIKQKDSEQTHISLALKGIEYGSDELYSLLAVNNIFGGGMSSRLFQKVREEKGLAYSIYSFPSSYMKSGIFCVYAGLNPKMTDELLKIVMEELQNLKQNKLSTEEIKNSKEQLKGSYILGLEGTGGRMTSLGKSEVLLDKINSPDEILSKIDAINEESVNNVIDKIFDLSKICMAVVGNIKKDTDFQKLLKIN